MTPRVPALTLAALFLLLSLPHWYWALGGSRGFDAVLPTTGDGTRVLTPGHVASAAVAVALLVAASLALWRICPYDAGPLWLKRGGVWLIAAVFAARAIGDGRSIGFFKSVRSTRFARLDTLIYSPLCAIVASLAVWLGLAGG